MFYNSNKMWFLFRIINLLNSTIVFTRRWVSTMSRPFEVRFNPHTERVEVLDSVDKLETLIWQLNTEMLHLTNAVKKLKGSHFE